MTKDIISAEVELSVAANQITRYADFLAQSIQSYIRILSYIQEHGIHDDVVCARLSAIAASVEPAILELDEETRTIQQKINGFVADVEKADRLAFPTGVSEIVKALLAQLI